MFTHTIEDGSRRTLRPPLLHKIGAIRGYKVRIPLDELVETLEGRGEVRAQDLPFAFREDFDHVESTEIAFLRSGLTEDSWQDPITGIGNGMVRELGTVRGFYTSFGVPNLVYTHGIKPEVENGLGYSLVEIAQIAGYQVIEQHAGKQANEQPTSP